MTAHSFATLVTVREGALTATHLPLILDPAQGAQGALYGHVARGNSQWRDFDGDAEALVMFQGAQAYISPTWYAAGCANGQPRPPGIIPRSTPMARRVDRGPGANQCAGWVR